MTPEAAYYIMATIAVPIGAVWALLQWHAAVKQRKDELRWKRAEAAWNLMDKVFEDPEANVALEVMDGERDTIDVPGKGKAKISREDALKALDLTNPSDSDEARIIRYSFNCILYALDRLEIAIYSGYVLEEDVNSPTIYYARLLYGAWCQLEPYSRHVGYHRALVLISRLGHEAQPVAPADRQKAAPFSVR